MKKSIFCLISCLVVGIYLYASPQKREMKLSALYQQFSNPGKEFRTAPLWVWNTNVTTQDIDRMLLELKEQGFGGAFVHPRPSMETEYLSPEWFELWGYSLKKGKELGLDIWIYDENSYPSGFAGGHVPYEMPESYNQGISLIGRKTKTAPKANDCYMCILREGNNFKDITSELDKYQGKAGNYYVYKKGYKEASPWTAGFPYVDLMAKGVTEKFIEITMQRGYEKYLGQYLGNSIKGVFTDEPNIASPSKHDCRWTPDLFDEFKKRWGYDLRPYWPLLGEDTGNFRKIRHDYNATLLDLFINRWCKPWYEYTEKKGMVWTGHYWEHAWPYLAPGPDNMAMAAWHQLPAIDMLFNQYDDFANPRAQFGNIRSVKELSSVANQKGYVRTLCETYGGGGWDETFQDFKRLGDWEYALGVNFMNQHLCHMTITGIRKFDYPPVFTSLSPWWEDYGQLNDYYARLSLMLSQGEQRNDWLIMEPTTSIWMHFSQVAGGKPLWKIANAFQSFVTHLEKQQMEYDLGCENIIGNCGSITKEGFRIDQRTYKTVVLPPEMTNLESKTFELLKKFVAQGGRLIAFPELAYVDGEESEELKAFIKSSKITHLADANAVLELYRNESELKIKVEGGEHVFHHRRMYDDGQLLFISNASKDSVSEVSFAIPGKYLIECNAMTGERYVLPDASSDGKINHSLTLHPAGSAMFIISNKPCDDIKNYHKPSYGQPLQSVSEIRISPLHDNALCLDFCNLTVDGKSFTNVFHKEANRLLWDVFGMTDPWERSIQFKKNILECDTFTCGNTKVEYPIYVGDNVDLSNCHIIVEKPELWKVAVNGTEVPKYTVDKLLDARCGDYKIGKLLKQGNNNIVLSMKRLSIRTEIGPVILLGKFGVRPAAKGFSVVKEEPIQLGNYAKQTYPMYAWDMSYKKDYNISNPKVDHRIKLGKWNGTVAQVWINGKKTGTIAYPPYELDITGKLKSGKNTIEVRVIGSLANLYGPHYAEPIGKMGPFMWNDIKEQRSGIDYNLYPYGLEEDFIVE